MYKIPGEFYFRIHHVRPRFKDDVENVLFYMSHCCSSLKELPLNDYKDKLNSMIHLYPKNAGKKLKTINNWRTEISALFGFYIEDKITKKTKTGDIAFFLDKEQDLVQFFKFYLFKFQYPGGHLKSDRIKEYIDIEIKFKPAQYILTMLYSADKNSVKPLGITKEEATHCVFNDLRVTRDKRDVNETINLIVSNRIKRTEYQHGGDITRYAGDILDYMVYANLLDERHGYYYLNHTEMESVMVFVNNNDYFTGYDSFYKKTINIPELSEIESQWFKYVNHGLYPELFKTDLTSYFKEIENVDFYKTAVDDKIFQILEGAGSTKDIGDLGENLVLGHEKVVLKNIGREDLIHLVKKIPTSFAVGYDIQSVENDQRKRYIEVKTSISNKPLNFFNFHLTRNEWDSANTLNDRYFVYRLMINRTQKVIYILQNPVQMYKTDQISMRINDGAEISFKEDFAERKELLIWKD